MHRFIDSFFKAYPSVHFTNITPPGASRLAPRKKEAFNSTVQDKDINNTQHFPSPNITRLDEERPLNNKQQTHIENVSLE